MLNKFQSLVEQLLENNMAGEGGVFGTPQQPIYNPPINISSADKYAQGDARAIMGGIFPLENIKKGKKKKKKKKTPLIIRRNLQKSL
jgi:hypothetical protein